MADLTLWANWNVMSRIDTTWKDVVVQATEDSNKQQPCASGVVILLDASLLFPDCFSASIM